MNGIFREMQGELQEKYKPSKEQREEVRNGEARSGAQSQFINYVLNRKVIRTEVDPQGKHIISKSFRKV